MYNNTTTSIGLSDVDHVHVVVGQQFRVINNNKQQRTNRTRILISPQCDFQAFSPRPTMVKHQITKSDSTITNFIIASQATTLFKIVRSGGHWALANGSFFSKILKSDRINLLRPAANILLPPVSEWIS